MHVCLNVLGKRQRESVFVYNNVCVSLGVLIDSENKTPLTCAMFPRETGKARGLVARSAARRFPSYSPSSL